MSHTPTPWHCSNVDGKYIRLRPEDWERAVACVNAFSDDFPTEKITPGLVGRMMAVLKGTVPALGEWPETRDAVQKFLSEIEE